MKPFTSIATASRGAVVLLGFGGPNGPDEIRPFLDRVLGGRPIPRERYEEVVRHYELIGGRSPYNDFTQRLAQAISDTLYYRGIDVPVLPAYRNTPPFVKELYEQLVRDGTNDIRAVVLAPHGSSAAGGRYIAASEKTLAEMENPPRVTYVDSYFDDPLFIRAHANNVLAAAERLGADALADAHLLFTAHSIPLSVPDAETYVAQIQTSAKLVAEVAGAKQWSIAYQSRSGSPGDPWLEPDVNDALRDLASRGTKRVVIDPIGFLCDHVEVLYDLDVAAKETAATAGLRLERAKALNDDRLFVEMLAERILAFAT